MHLYTLVERISAGNPEFRMNHCQYFWNYNLQLNLLKIQAKSRIIYIWVRVDSQFFVYYTFSDFSEKVVFQNCFFANWLVPKFQVYHLQNGLYDVSPK